MRSDLNGPVVPVTAWGYAGIIGAFLLVMIAIIGTIGTM